MALKHLNLSQQIGKYITHVSDYDTLCMVNKCINKSQVSPFLQESILTSIRWLSLRTILYWCVK